MSVRRILVAIDTSPGSLAAAEAAARLAARLEAELEGLFVEDVRLLRLVQSPLAREVDTLTASRRQPASKLLKRQFRLQGLRAREELGRIADRLGISWSFRVARGAVSSEIAAAAAGADIVSLGQVGWSARPQRALGAAASAVLEHKSSCTLLMRRTLDVRTPVLVLYDGSDQGERALALARQLAGDEPGALEVLLIGADESVLRSRLESAASTEAKAAVIGVVGSATDPGLARALKQAAAGSLVVPVGGDPAHREILHDILSTIDCPVLLVS
ncbi:MAG: universal stress protein [Acidobacteriota bacterium]|nr:universal stress protein [Acidobacteriota bacterium]